jgi:peroxiredoxin
VAWYGSDDDFGAFVDEYGLTFTQLSDPDGEVFARFGVASQPAVAIVDAAGAVTVLRGATDGDELDVALTDLGA